MVCAGILVTQPQTASLPRLQQNGYLSAPGYTPRYLNPFARRAGETLHRLVLCVFKSRLMSQERWTYTCSSRHLVVLMPGTKGRLSWGNHRQIRAYASFGRKAPLGRFPRYVTCLCTMGKRYVLVLEGTFTCLWALASMLNTARDDRSRPRGGQTTICHLD